MGQGGTGGQGLAHAQGREAGRHGQAGALRILLKREKVEAKRRREMKRSAKWDDIGLGSGCNGKERVWREG